MANSQPPLPRFDAPPVVETVVGVYFEPIRKFDIAQRSLFWSRVRDEFPRLEEKPPIEEVREDLGDDGPFAGPQIRWQVGDFAMSPRLWAKSDDGRHTIQIQQDCLLVNWERDPEGASKYWPYSERRQDLADKLTQLQLFLRESNIGDIRPTSCFATYVNHINYERADQFSETLERLLTCWSNQTSDGWMPPLEQGGLHLMYAMPDQQGRLHVNLVPAMRRTGNERMLRMDLTARGTPRETTIEAALNWVDSGHEWIVRGFTSLTRPEMHKLWRRTQ